MLFAATYLGIPVSTTHTVTGSVIGVGAARKVSAVRWHVATDIVVAWIVTVPASGVMAAFFYELAGLLARAGEPTGHLIFVILMGFISFGSMAVLFASIIGAAVWVVSRLAR
jgi:hypothetical protein